MSVCIAKEVCRATHPAVAWAKAGHGNVGPLDGLCVSCFLLCSEWHQSHGRPDSLTAQPGARFALSQPAIDQWLSEGAP